ncbi:MAG: exopolysaccharide biosynthesis protein [Tagaea sp.]|nr:exopolysaccharide biosynthesis protein [Tagaea sp.]
MSGLGLVDAFGRAVEGPDDVKATLGELVAKLETRGYGVLLFLFAAPNLTPGPSMPGFSTVFALPLVLIAAQMAWGVPSPKLPGFLARLGVARPRARSIVAYLAPTLGRVEKLLRPRWPRLLTPGIQKAIGAVAILEAVLLLIPLPFLPIIPSVALTIVALGLIARDGAAVALGLGACAVAAVAFAAALILGAAALGLA